VIAVSPTPVIWFGFGMLPKILMAAVIAFFPVVINGTAGFSAVDRESLNLMRSLNASPWKTFIKLRVPASLPYMFAGLKNAAVISVIGAIVGEWVGAERGLGPVIIAANSSFETALLFAAVLYLAITGVALFLIVSAIERLTIPWYFLTRADGNRSG
jgi:ABC-type nitrate/sulfonate/bicarbonate transport system permease component